MSDTQGIRGRLAQLYDVFVDWEGRLGREFPPLVARLREAGAQRVLDAGCGTGRHTQALLAAGFDAFGSDVSEDMLDRARALAGTSGRFCQWRLGDEPPEELAAQAPFDAIVSLGNVWPQLVEAGDVERALSAFTALLRPGGLVLLGLKAFAVRRAAHQPYLPLLRREHGGRALFFVRFLDFAPSPQEPEVAAFHFLIAGEASGDTPAVCHHHTGRVRVWSYAGLAQTLRAAGFHHVAVSARIDDPAVAPDTENVFVHATRAD